MDFANSSRAAENRTRWKGFLNWQRYLSPVQGKAHRRVRNVAHSSILFEPMCIFNKLTQIFQQTYSDISLKQEQEPSSDGTDAWMGVCSKVERGMQCKISSFDI